MIRFVDTLMLSGVSRGKNSRVAATRPVYPPELRQEAVRLLRSSGKTIRVIAREVAADRSASPAAEKLRPREANAPRISDHSRLNSQPFVNRSA